MSKYGISDYEQGQLWWQQIKRAVPFQTNQEFQEFAPQAKESASRMVARLAPELEPRTEEVHNEMFSQVMEVLVHRETNIYVAWAGGTLLRDRGGECCAYTFNLLDSAEMFIPPWERALTFYLYKKLLPERFASRPMERRHSWW